MTSGRACLRIGISMLTAVPEAIVGITAYVKSLLAALEQVEDQNEYFVFVAPWNRHVFVSSNPRFHFVVCPVPKYPNMVRALWEQLAMPVLAIWLRIDVFHGPANTVPLMLPCPSVVTVHDVLPFRFADLVPSWSTRSYLRFMIAAATRVSKHVITDSHYSRQEIVRLLACPEAKVTTVYLGPGILTQHLVAQVTRDDAILQMQPYILWIGKAGLYSGKNVKGVLDAYSILNMSRKIPHRLVLCGIDRHRNADVIDYIAQLHLEENVVCLTHVSDMTIVQLYQSADVYVFPALYAGFGLTILEAMACGTPVVTSHGGAVAEVAGDAAQLVDPEVPEHIAAGILEVVANREKREQLIQAGLQRVSSFSWLKAAEDVLRIYTQVGGK